MRKKNFFCIVDTLFWWIVYALPIVVWLISLSTDTPVYSDLQSIIDQGFSNNSIIYDSLYKIIGRGSEINLPLIGDSQLQLFVWFISANILHLLVDFILFIPRLCHNWLEKFTSGR